MNENQMKHLEDKEDRWNGEIQKKKIAELIPEKYRSFLDTNPVSTMESKEKGVFRLYESGVGEDILQLSWIRNRSINDKSLMPSPFFLPNPELHPDEIFDYLPMKEEELKSNNLKRKQINPHPEKIVDHSPMKTEESNSLKRKEIHPEWLGGSPSAFLDLLQDPSMDQSKMKSFLNSLEYCDWDNCIDALLKYDLTLSITLTIRLIAICSAESLVDMILQKLIPEFFQKMDKLSENMSRLLLELAKVPCLVNMKPQDFRVKLRQLKWSQLGVVGVECERQFVMEYYKNKHL